LNLPEREEKFTLGAEEKPDDWAITHSVPDAETVAGPGHAPEPDMTPDIPVEHFNEDRAEEDEEAELESPDDEADRTRRDGANLRALFVFLAFVVAGYGVLTRALFASPLLFDRTVGRLPFIGRVGDDRLLARKVALSEVAGSYQRIKDGKEVFVITGKALNTSPVALHGVQIDGALYNNAGKAVDEKTIYCGNVISAKVLKDLTPRELSILQKLNPPKRFMIEPGESATFVIVFMDPPREAVEFSTQVVGAQRQT
jgi:hypothetical protein